MGVPSSTAALDAAPNCGPAGTPRSVGTGIPTAGAVPRRPIILEADDLGLVYAFNEGILAAYRDGVLTSTCLRANGLAYEHAIGDVLPACADLGVGVHLCLNEAGPVAPAAQVPALLDHRGQLRAGFVWLMRLARTSEGMAQIERELRAQIEKVLGDGVRIDHLNSHQHVHMIPPIFRLTCRLAREYGVSAVRLVRELRYFSGGLRKRVQPYVNTGIVKHVLLNRLARVNELAAQRFGLCTTDYFVGVSYTAHMNLRAVLDGLRAAPFGSVEVLLHPALGPDPRDVRYPSESLRRYVTARQRRMELASLRAPELAVYLHSENCRPLGYAAWAAQRNARKVTTHMPEITTEMRRIGEGVALRCPLWVSDAQKDCWAFAELALTQSRPGEGVLDVGTGTGVLAICLARAGRRVTAIDISGAAVRTARANAARNGVEIECYESDLLERVRGRFDLILFNPPYGFGPDNLATNVAKRLLRQIPWVRHSSGRAMPRGVLRYHQQLMARLARQAPGHLNEGGRLLIHAYENEVDALIQALPEGAQVERLQHPALAPIGTVGMLIRE